jgi:transglutaminase-like putative cysteine protease
MKSELDGDPHMRRLYDALHESRYVICWYRTGFICRGSGDGGRDDLVAWYVHVAPSLGRNVPTTPSDFARIAWGRDYRGVAPIRGVYKGDRA